MESVLSTTTTISAFLGSYMLDNSHYNQLKESFMQSMLADMPIVQESYTKCTSNEDRIALFQKYIQWVPPPQNIIEQLGKCETTSENLRRQGNSEYKNNQSSPALRCYNLAINFAPTDSYSLGVAYSNRSTLLMHMKEYEGCLQDITRATEILQKILQASSEKTQKEEDIDRLLEKLVERKAKCEQAFKSGDLKNDHTKQYYDTKWGTLKKPSQKLVGAEDFVKLECDSVKGRHLVAASSIPAGTMLLREKPYAVELEGLLTWNTTHCATCAQLIIAGIPDEQSTFPSYCSIDCKSNGILHLLPNELLTYLHKTDVGLHHALLPLIVAIKGASSNATTEDDKGVYDPTEYSTAYNLIQHFQKYPFSSSGAVPPPNEFYALFLSHLVESLAPHLPPVRPSTLLHHLESLPFNSITLCTWPPPQGEPAPYANAILPLIAMANNSCDPNAILFKPAGSNQAFLLSIRRIKEGEEIVLSYKAHWSRCLTAERQDYFQTKYKFSCDCLACQNDWNLGDVIDVADVEDLSPEDEEGLEGVADEMERSVLLLEDGKASQAFECIIPCVEFLSKFDSKLRLGILAGDLLRSIIMRMT